MSFILTDVDFLLDQPAGYFQGPIQEREQHPGKWWPVTGENQFYPVTRKGGG